MRDLPYALMGVCVLATAIGGIFAGILVICIIWYQANKRKPKE